MELEGIIDGGNADALTALTRHETCTRIWARERPDATWVLVDPGIPKIKHVCIDALSDTQLGELWNQYHGVASRAVYGSRMRLWFFQDRWNVSTTTRLDAYSNHWCSKESLGAQLDAALATTPLPTTLQTHIVYHVILRYQHPREGIVQAHMPLLTIVAQYDRANARFLPMKADPLSVTCDSMNPRQLAFGEEGLVFRNPTTQLAEVLLTGAWVFQFVKLRGSSSNLIKQYMWVQQHYPEETPFFMRMYPQYATEFLHVDELLYQQAVTMERFLSHRRSRITPPRILYRYRRALRNMRAPEIHHFILHRVPLRIRWRMLLPHIADFTCHSP